MDIMALGGTVAGAYAATRSGRDPGQLTLILLLSAEFFSPMRTLGSFFHVAMNGLSACKILFKLLDAKEEEESEEKQKEKKLDLKSGAKLEKVTFKYDESDENSKIVLNNVTMEVKPGIITALVGQSGCGKSTAAALLSGRLSPISGKVGASGRVIVVSHDSPLLSGELRDTLTMGREDAETDLII